MNKQKFLLDTGVWISYFGRVGFPERTTKAKQLFDLFNGLSHEVLFSYRTENELKKWQWNERKPILELYNRATYYVGEETMGQIQGHWNNIGSTWELSALESETAIKIKKWLNKDRDLNDRGILLDAVFNGCSFFMHENPNDYDKIDPHFWIDFNIVNVDLLSISMGELIEITSKS